MKSKEFHLELIEMLKLLVSEKKTLCITTIISALLGVIISISLPKQYTVNIDLATESGGNTNSSIGNMASFLGITNLNLNNNEALNTGIYSNIIESTPFMLEVINSNVKQNSKTIQIKNYLNELKQPWWNLLFNLKNNNITKNSTEKQNNILKLKSDEIKAISILKQALKTEMQRKTNIFSITITLQDPYITAIIADSIAYKLQKYVTNYRTQKAINNYKYLESLYIERKAEYYEMQQKYAQYIDMNRDLQSQKATIAVERLKNEVNLSYQIYTQIATQLELAKAKIQEEQPILSIIEPAYIPANPSAPNK